ncbi:hypothetical protein [Micromonospora sp. NPDC048830]|uniref:hypothetical protein n=1 Tax=Micromonospora sp. NPDC048830 TaxID=3364257 RepID=UPI003721A527
MALVVSFVGISSHAAVGAYRIWSYKINGTGAELPQGQRVALAFPSNVNVQDPALFPSVAQLDGTFVWQDPGSGRQRVASAASSQAGQVTVSFVAPAQASDGNLQLYTSASGAAWTQVPFATASGGATGTTQTLILPAPVAPSVTGRPVYDFEGALPYATELFGVYQPVIGWISQHPAQSAALALPGAGAGGPHPGQAAGAGRGTLSDEALAAVAGHYSSPAAAGGLSPVGLMNLFRQYFFEFDTFLGAPAGHIWVSPGGTVEVIESSTRRTLVERLSEISEEISRKTEESLTDQDDIAEAVKEDNATDTKLGVSATGGVNAKIFHADASANFSVENTVKRGAEATHKHTRTQTAKVTSEIKRNYRTSFRTVTETVDTSSRRYVLQNNGMELANYELRRKMRKVGVQLQHVGSRLCWQLYLGEPGADLGLGDLVHVVEAPDLTSINRPEKLPPLEAKQVPFHFDIPFLHDAGPDDDAEETYTPHPDNRCRGLNESTAGTDDTIQFCFEVPLPPVPKGYELDCVASLDKHGAQVEFAPFDADDLRPNPDTAKNTLKLRLTYANFQGRKSLPFDAVLLYRPTEEANREIEKINADAEAAYRNEVARLQREAYGKAVRERLRLVSSLRARPAEDLRREERRWVFRSIIRLLEKWGQYPTSPEPAQGVYLEAEKIQRLFDVDEMLYFVAPDFWRPGPVNPPAVDRDSVGRYPVPPEESSLADGTATPSRPQAGSVVEVVPRPLPLSGQTVAGWYSRVDEYQAAGGQPSPEWRVNYLITEQTQPAPLGSSLGWLIQIDADARRNEFLNAAWVKVVMPVRPGQEALALEWLIQLEGDGGHSTPYDFRPGDPDAFRGKTVGEVLKLLAKQLQDSNTDVDKTLAAEKVFETGFDPLVGGFRKDPKPFEVFDQWIEVLPTDQIAAVMVRYDPRTGQQV